MLLRRAFVTKYWFSNSFEAWGNPRFSSCLCRTCLSKPKGLIIEVCGVVLSCWVELCSEESKSKGRATGPSGFELQLHYLVNN